MTSTSALPTPRGEALLRSVARVDAVDRARPVAAAGEARLRRTVDLAARLLGADVGCLSLVGEDVELLVATAGPRAHLLPAGLLTADSLCQHLVVSGACMVLPDLAEAAGLAGVAPLRSLGLLSYAGTPLLSEDGHVIGGLCVGTAAPRAWTPAEAALLADLASAVEGQLQLGVTVRELAALRAAEQRRAEEQAGLHRVASAVARGDSSEVVLAQVAEELAGRPDVSAALVLRFGPDGEAQLVAGAGEPAPALPVLAGCANALARVRATGRPARGEHDDRPCAAAAVVVGGQVWGAVLVLAPDEPDDAALAQLEQLVDLIALLVVNTDAQQRLWQIARSDVLTGVANRRALDERLVEELQRAERFGRPLTLLLLDVDHFKRTNDSAGHEVGDRVLCELAGRLRDGMREIDLLGRLGGDEFVLLLPETDQARAMVVADRVRHRVADRPVAGRAVTVSIGVAVVSDGSSSAQRVYRAADEAMYEAKARGRNAVALLALTPP